MDTLLQGITENWTIWFVTVVLIVAAVIDGMILKVPNWLTFPFIICGWAHCFIQGGFPELGYSLLGTFVGMMLLLPLRNVGGMGAGDVKLLAGIGAWCGTMITLKAFAATAIVGGIMAAFMIWKSGAWVKHYAQFWKIMDEWRTIRKPEQLAAIARERKPTMYLLPYGIPMAIGTIIYFAATGQLV
ncbi:A24 family peptidase [Rhodopirellula baltica]|uniref:Peptidase A24A prepilin type IV n=3 Tax=Rhodopirellula baltica TaxID=265606 RepID=F2ASL5_RHOBT|nr:A24 family peptidase [Rhodopirellula baltica]EGF27321.1 peptidase A24A prepilin type IV [Rhodopirellula baltica WH47]ELP34336.1 peptidase A24A prepilin type IV [Rhodopirellula baltica SWK14]CAD78326.1 similar to type IV prepilin peptidase CpaA [Rhodopirellula baltica SH 1]HBE63218.1 prepilin peptidase [Rhodopirellula baltica]